MKDGEPPSILPMLRSPSGSCMPPSPVGRGPAPAWGWPG